MSYVLGLEMQRVRPSRAGVAGACVRAVLRAVRGRVRLREDEGEGHARIDRQAGRRVLWRYKDLLPVDEPEGRVSFRLHAAEAGAIAWRRSSAASELYIKDDSCNYPTYSYKERVVSVAITKAIEFGFDTVGCASTGNLANSHRRPRGAGGASLLRDDSARSGAGQSARLADLRADDGADSRQLRRCESPLHRDRRQVRLGDREREPAAVLHRRRQDLRL